MADIVGPLRPSDSWSTTEVRTLQHSHVWTIHGFSQCDCRYLETSVKIREAVQFSVTIDSDHTAVASTADGNQLTFRIRLHPQGNKESNKDFSFFQVFCNTHLAKYRAKFSVYNAKNDEAPTTVYTGTQQLHGYFEYIRRDILVTHVQPQDELQLVLNLTITFDTVTRTSQSQKSIGFPDSRPIEIARDLEVLFKEGRLTDFIVEASGCELKAHQAVLSARSPVFAAMLESHTEEFKNGRVIVPDIDYEVMHELLTYMYSGRSPNLTNMALDLLAAADRFQLPGLKEMADQVLRSGLVTESVCRYLVFADMHDARELKADAIRFIAQNCTSVITTDGWSELVKDHGSLVTEVVSAIASNESRSTSSCGSNCEPAIKRSRCSGL